MEELKPCPVCGAISFVIVLKEIIHERYHLECCKCGRYTLWYDSKQEAIDAWNKRS